MRKLILVVAALAGWALQAQEAKVIALDAQDTKLAQTAWNNLQEAQKEWDAAQALVRDKYLSQSPNTGNFILFGSEGRQRVPGFENGFQFSENFKYIVPKPYTANQWNWTNCYVTTPLTQPTTGTNPPGFTYNEEK